ncbi:TRAP-type mannitol/chloroaromatic compound transport system permease small subunit [Hyphomicrobiales bacterium]|nr:TRAP-type mannitol/chloroaromatic compound transport system permease small subunit [Hyphomicrobiales bacterium]CAH1669115.1 TRAP-type mannitol/chloroaromatic compound transport system permease small subunit [Hyphomicrobiales bacterium]
MRHLLAFSRLIDGISKSFGNVADWFVLGACLISAGNAVVRYLFSFSTNGMLEIQWYLFAGIVFLGAQHTLCMNEHVRVDLVYGNVSDRGRLWIDALGLAFLLIPGSILLAYLSFPFFWQSFRIHEMSQNAGGLILWPVKMLLPVGFTLMALQGLSELIKRIAALRNELKLETKYEKPLQ